MPALVNLPIKRAPLLPRFTLLLALIFCASGVRAEYQISVNLEGLYFDYQEAGDSGSLNQESGWLPGLSLNVNKKLGSYTFGMDAGLYSGSVDYEGQTQGGADLRTETEQQIYRIAAHFKWQPSGTDYGLYTRLGYWQWRRDIQPTAASTGLFEIYQWQFLEAGLSATLWHSGRRRLSLDIGYAHIYDAELDVDLRPFGFGQPNLTLGDASHGVISRLSYLMPLDANGHLQLAFTHRYWNLKQSKPETVSNGTTILNVKEPESEANHISLKLSYVYFF
ncbi:hypothetical protein [Marinobacter sp. CHS3-4]|uniref:hypothetical protein n=1 Tax=Marinobacter sp. CHS3-4 TaxID=3045174 RepID=UPI0024B4F409|nr:hypothetical protein [Marinobacter sp. CHS3-4]MDI9245657.1 hypothetical protein [Marinobacter sp. CHS3-4]